ncbi:MAG: tetratricopeptide repeat protein [Bacteroidota bacterium]
MKIDSLLRVLEKMDNDTNKVNTLVGLALAYTNVDPELSISSAKESVTLARELNFERGVLAGLNQIGLGYYRAGDYKAALPYLDEVVATAKDKAYPEMALRSLNLKGVVYKTTGNFDQAATCYFEVLNLAQELRDSTMITSALGNIGNVHLYQDDYEQALAYYQQALQVDRAIGYELGEAINLGNIGLTYIEDSLTEEALKYFDQSLTISRKIEDTYGVAYMLCCLSSAHLQQGEIELAERYCMDALLVAEELKTPEIHITALRNLANLEQEKRRYDSSNDYAREAIILAERVDDQSSKQKLLRLMADNYASLKQFEQAFATQQRFQAVSDSLFDDQKSRQVLELSIQYETTQKEIENELLREEQAKNEAIIRNRNVLVWSGFIILGLVSLLAFTQFRHRKKIKRYNEELEDKVIEQTTELQTSNKQLKRSGAELERFAYIASHDLKEPLRNINSFTGLLERRLGGSNEEVKAFLKHLKDNASQMNVLVERIIEFTRLEGSQPLVETVDLSGLLEEVKESLSDYFTARNGILYPTALPTIKTDSTQVFLVLKTLLENGLKYNESEVPIVSVQYVEMEDFHHLKIKDNGIGIAPEFQKDVFVMFKRLRGSGENRGAGLGLSMSKKIVESLGGQIWIESSQNKATDETPTGTTFVFSLPKS